MHGKVVDGLHTSVAKNLMLLEHGPGHFFFYIASQIDGNRLTKEKVLKFLEAAWEHVTPKKKRWEFKTSKLELVYLINRTLRCQNR